MDPTQRLLTEEPQNYKAGPSSRATDMVRTKLQFTLAFDYVLLGETGALFSVVLIQGSVFSTWLCRRNDPTRPTKARKHEMMKSLWHVR